MLTKEIEPSVVPQAQPQATPKPKAQPAPKAKPAWVAKALSIEWFGQTVASLCWIVSVFVYGIEGTGDYLQLGAASAWFIANMAALFASKGN